MRKGEGLVEDSGASSKEKKNDNAAVISRILTQRSWGAMGMLCNLTKEKVESLDPNLKDFYQNFVEVTVEQSVAIATVNQGTNAWLDERNKRVTASTARSQYTYFKNSKADWDTRYQELYHSTFKGNEDTIRGLRCEGPARDWYEEKTSTKVYECGLIVRPELPWLGASLDGIVVDNDENIVRTIEIKTFKEGKRLNAAELLEMKVVKTLNANGELKKTNDHYGQVHIGLLLSGIPECDYLGYSEKGRDAFTTRVKFDEPYVIDLVSTRISVYFDIFLPKMMLDYSTSTEES